MQPWTRSTGLPRCHIMSNRIRLASTAVDAGAVKILSDGTLTPHQISASPPKKSRAAFGRHLREELSSRLLIFSIAAKWQSQSRTPKFLRFATSSPQSRSLSPAAFALFSLSNTLRACSRPVRRLSPPSRPLPPLSHRRQLC